MEQNGKHLAEMQNVAAIDAALKELGGQRPEYAVDLVTLCKCALEQGMPLDAVIAALAEMVAAHDTIKELHLQICDQVTELFRAAMLSAIEQRPYFNLEHAVQNNQLFDADTVERFALLIGSCRNWVDEAFLIEGTVVGSELDPNPFKDGPIFFTANFSSDCVYDSYQEWTKDDFENCFDDVYLNGLQGGAEGIDMLRSIKAWLDRYVTAARLSQD